MYKFLTTPLDICCEFGSSDDVYARGKATTETADHSGLKGEIPEKKCLRQSFNGFFHQNIYIDSEKL